MGDVNLGGGGGGMGFWLWILIGRGFVSWVDGVWMGLEGRKGGREGKGECDDMEQKRGWSGRNIYKWKVENGGEDGSKLESISDFNRVAGLVR